MQIEIKTVNPVLTPQQASDLLGISRWKLDELRKLNQLPTGSWFEIPSTGTGQKQIIRYRAQVLIQWGSGPIAQVG